MESKLEIVTKLFRLRPVIAWSVCTFIVTIASGIHDGLELNVFVSISSLLCLLIMQGILSHATNDLVDENVDKDTDMESTNRFKVLVSGIASRKDLFMICVLSTIISLIIGIYIYSVRGLIILILLASGLFIIYAYNCKPLKLNYRPLSEFTVVFPTIILIALGVSYSTFGVISETIIYSAIACGMMSVLWYLFSRLQDSIPDFNHGKITTMSYLYGKYKSDPPTNNWLMYACNYICFQILFSVIIVVVLLPNIYLISVACYIYFGGVFVGRLFSPRHSSNYVVVSSYMRRVGMYMAYLHCILLSIVLLI